ncbi:hypothetical protein [Yeosuana sp.]
MKKLDLQESSNVIGGRAPSARRCDRLYRRAVNGSDSALDTYLRIC